MGGGSSKGQIYRDDLTAKNYYKQKLEPKLGETYSALGLSAAQGRKFFDYFVTIDADGGGTVDQEEFHEHFELQHTQFTEHIFGELDLQDTGELTFQQFLLGIWNLCSLDADALRTYVFNIFDADRSGELDVPEVEALVNMLYGTEEHTPAVAHALKRMDADGDGNVSIQEFLQYTNKFKDLVKPLVELQQTMRKGLFGPAMWRRTTKWRNKEYGAGTNMKEILLRQRREMLARSQREAEERRIEEEKKETERLNKEAAEQKKQQEKDHKEEMKKRSKENETQTQLRLATDALDAERAALSSICEQVKAARKQENAASSGKIEGADGSGGGTDGSGAKRGSELAGESGGGKPVHELVEERDERVRSTRRAANAFFRAQIADLKSDRALAMEASREKIRKVAEKFFTTVDGKKLMQVLMDDELRLMATGGMAASRNQRAKESAFDKYVERKVRDAQEELTAEFDGRDARLEASQFKLKDVIEGELGEEKRVLASWRWQQAHDEASKSNYFYCAATDTSIWDQPWDNVKSKCAKCGRKLCATLRCFDCGEEFCVECDPTMHFGNMSHHNRAQISPDELSWRRARRKFDSSHRTSRKVVFLSSMAVKSAEAVKVVMEAESDFVAPR